MNIEGTPGPHLEVSLTKNAEPIFCGNWLWRTEQNRTWYITIVAFIPVPCLSVGSFHDLPPLIPGLLIVSGVCLPLPMTEVDIIPGV